MFNNKSKNKKYIQNNLRNLVLEWEELENYFLDAVYSDITLKEFEYIAKDNLKIITKIINIINKDKDNLIAMPLTKALENNFNLVAQFHNYNNLKHYHKQVKDLDGYLDDFDFNYWLNF